MLAVFPTLIGYSFFLLPVFPIIIGYSQPYLHLLVSQNDIILVCLGLPRSTDCLSRFHGFQDVGDKFTLCSYFSVQCSLRVLSVFTLHDPIFHPKNVSLWETTHVVRTFPQFLSRFFLYFAKKLKVVQAPESRVLLT